ncbi:hypothetical protein BY996DRAFT_6502126, partial [Phakopsora pachyrhizi]
MRLLGRPEMIHSVLFYWKIDQTLGVCNGYILSSSVFGNAQHFTIAIILFRDGRVNVLLEYSSEGNNAFFSGGTFRILVDRIEMDKRIEKQMIK